MMKTRFCGRCWKRASMKAARQHQKTAIARREVVMIAKSEFRPLCCKLQEEPRLTSFVTGPNQRSSDSVRAHGLQAIHPLLSQRTTVQRLQHRSKSHAVQLQGVNGRRNSERRNASRNALRQPTDAKGELNVEKQMVCQTHRRVSKLN
jgi:hypothetical protein